MWESNHSKLQILFVRKAVSWPSQTLSHVNLVILKMNLPPLVKSSRALKVWPCARHQLDLLPAIFQTLPAAFKSQHRGTKTQPPAKQSCASSQMTPGHSDCNAHGHGAIHDDCDSHSDSAVQSDHDCLIHGAW